MSLKKRIANFVMPTEFNYVVLGDPIPLSKVTECSGQSMWDAYKQSRFHYVQTIKNIHDTYFPGASFLEGATRPRQLVEGPLRLDATFYMRSSPAHRSGELHKLEPPIFSLFNFLEHALAGVVYKTDLTLSAVNLMKIYDDNPRTEIKITRL